MAELKERLRADLNDAMRARDQVRMRTLRLALTSITNEEGAGASAFKKAIVSFANSLPVNRTGILFIGVDDQGAVKGCHQCPTSICGKPLPQLEGAKHDDSTLHDMVCVRFRRWGDAYQGPVPAGDQSHCNGSRTERDHVTRLRQSRPFRAEQQHES